jgi:glutamyl-tRNA reductase
VQRLRSEILGLSLDRRAPSWLRERAPAGAARRRELLDALATAAPERVVLHTCERLELYVAAEGGDASSLLSPFAEWLGVSPVVLASYALVHRSDDAVDHLFRVVAGLESRLVGEPQIRGQVRQALAEAREARVVGPSLDALFRAALHAGRLVHRDTALARGTSLVDLTLARLRDDLAGLRGRTVVVAGTGRLAGEIAAALSGSGALVAVASRSLERATALAARARAEAISYDGLDRCLARAEALVACTHGLLPIPAETLAGRRLSVLDLGVPSNVPASVAPLVRLTRLDDLTGTAAGPEIAKALAIVANEQAHYRRGRAQRAARVLEDAGRTTAAA